MARKLKDETVARRIVSHLPENKQDRAYELAMNVLFMEHKLEQTRREISSTGVVIAYNNGGGQTGIRRNPAMDGYESLLKSYMGATRQLDEMLKEAAEEEKEENKAKEATPLENIISTRSVAYAES